MPYSSMGGPRSKSPLKCASDLLTGGGGGGDGSGGGGDGSRRHDDCGCD